MCFLCFTASKLKRKQQYTASMCSARQQREYKKYLDTEEKRAGTLMVHRDNTWQNGRGMLISLNQEEKGSRTQYTIFLARACGDCYWGGVNDYDDAVAAFGRAVAAYTVGGCMAASEQIRRSSETPFP
jgi:hypothetical protein